MPSASHGSRGRVACPAGRPDPPPLAQRGRDRLLRVSAAASSRRGGSSRTVIAARVAAVSTESRRRSRKMKVIVVCHGKTSRLRTWRVRPRAMLMLSCASSTCPPRSWATMVSVRAPVLRKAWRERVRHRCGSRTACRTPDWLGRASLRAALAQSRRRRWAFATPRSPSRRSGLTRDNVRITPSRAGPGPGADGGDPRGVQLVRHRRQR